MRRLALLIAVLILIPLPAQGEEAPCAPGLIHYLPYCLTETEYQALTAPAPTMVVSGVEQWRPMVAYYWPAVHVDRMLRIMDCESGGDPQAFNPRTGVKGLFQIHPLWQRVWAGDYYDPWINAATAYQIWLVQGYRAWVCKGLG